MRTIVLGLVGVVFAACAPVASGPATPAATTQIASPRPSPANPELFVGTTTTTQDTGLLDALIPDFERVSGYHVKLVVAGTGAVLQQAARGDLDVILTHSPPDEEDFVRAGNGVDRTLVMHNDFVLVGPAGDPVHVRGLDILAAFRAVYDAGAPFISRGDRSGTNVKELALWQQAGRKPLGRPWYIEASVGQLQGLQLGAERHAYVFADRGTWLANQKLLGGLDLLVQGGVELLNIYHVTTVNQAKFPKVNLAGAKAFAEYLVSPQGQALISGFDKNKFGQALFTPDAGKSEDDLLK